MTPVPAARIRLVNAQPRRPDRRHVVYWMTAHRRLRSNFALEHAAGLAVDLGRPLVIFEAVRVDYQWASDRLHRFIVDGMADHARSLRGLPVQYVPLVEAQRGDGRRFFASLCHDAAAVVTDDYPTFFLPGAVSRAGTLLDAELTAVDSNGILPMRSADRAFTTAFSFRAHVQRTIREHLSIWPSEIDWQRLPRASAAWIPPAGTPAATSVAELERPDRLLASLPIDHGVRAVPIAGGERAAAATVQRFVSERLARYGTDRNHPDLDATSGLSPYLHFGHVSAHDVFSALMTAEAWTSRKLGTAGGGKRDGWWHVSPSAEAFLDQLIIWRELGFHACAADPASHTTMASVPEWARRTLQAHAADPRPWRYSFDELESAATHDEVWNAAQRQMCRDGWMHNYLRMLWGKKILEWSASPEAALDTMIRLMNRHAIDGRDPNSYTGYLWTLGLYDRPWAPTRPIFGSVRYMSSDNTKRKLKLRRYLERYGPASPAC